jgi:protein TonB
MSFAPPFPRISTRPRAGAQRWCAAAVAVVVNLGVVVVLGRLARPERAEAPPPLTAMTLHRVPPPPPPQASPPAMSAVGAPVQADAAVPPAEAAMVAAACDPDLPGQPMAGPPDAGTGPLQTLSLAMPDPTSWAAGAAVPSPGPVDQPAVREGAFDLERHYPRAARLRGLGGSTRIRLAISAAGRVTAVEILASTPPGVFEQAAERLARDLRFTPATSAGMPAASSQITTITWTLR